jgi:predicted nuclease with RNAse H fold
MRVVGLDLGGVETRPTGFCLLTELNAETELLYTNAEILACIDQVKPDVIGVDAPLSLPPGRTSLEERTSEHLRESDRELLRRGIKFFPITLGPMRKLTARGIYLREVLEKNGFLVLEVYPGGAQDVLGIPRKQQGLDRLRLGLEKLGIAGLGEGLSDQELDAVTCAYVGRLFLEEKTVTYGLPNDGIVMPRGEKQPFKV